jgi:hypothetical protein
MPVTYTNRKGHTYVLCQGTTKNGKPRYYFAREAKDEALEQIPEGYRISESVNGIVSLVKDQPQLIYPEEVAILEAALKRHPKGRNYRVSAKRDQILIYERIGPDAEEISAIFGKFSIFPEKKMTKSLQERLDQTARFTPVMRFVLVDEEKRTYIAERWCYLGSIDDWVGVDSPDKLEALVRRLAPKLGTEAFFDLH